MFGIRYAKFQPTQYVMKVKNGKVVKEGIGLSFTYYAPTTSVVVVPISSIDVPFMFEEMTEDYQAITVQGQLTYRIADYRQITGLLNYTYDLKKHVYLSDDPAKLNQRIINLAKVHAKHELARMPLRVAVQSSERLAQQIKTDVRESEQLEALGVELMGVAVLAVLPNKETMRALEATAREEILEHADQALYRRRNASIEQERRLKENELSTEMAVEAKKRQIREAQLDADRAVRQKEQRMEEEQLQFETDMEQSRHQLIELAAANKRAEADVKAYELGTVMKSLHGIEPGVLQALANLGMNPDKLIAIAFQDLADKAERIGQLNISPDLLQGLLSGQGSSTGGGASGRGAGGR